MNDDDGVIDLEVERKRRNVTAASVLFEEVCKVASALAHIMLKAGTMHMMISDKIGKYSFTFEVKITEDENELG